MSWVPEKCSCGVYTVMAETPAGVLVAVDPAPHPDGLCELIQRQDQAPLFRYVPSGKRPGRRDLRVEHASTCRLQAEVRKQPRPSFVPDMWLLAKTFADQPYPCLCHHGSVGCRSGHRYCPCVGRSDLDHLPLACCAVLAMRAARLKEKQSA